MNRNFLLCPLVATFTAQIDPPPGARLVGIELNPGPSGGTASTSAAWLFSDGLHTIFEFLRQSDWATCTRVSQYWSSSCRTMPSREIYLSYPADPEVVQQIQSVSASQLRRHITEIVIDHPIRRELSSMYIEPYGGRVYPTRYLSAGDYTSLLIFLPSFMSLSALTLKNLPFTVDCSPLLLLISLHSLTLVVDPANRFTRELDHPSLSESEKIYAIFILKNHACINSHRQFQLRKMREQMRTITEIPNLQNFSLYHGLFFDYDYTMIWMKLMLYNMYSVPNPVAFAPTVHFNNLRYDQFLGGDLALLSRVSPGQRSLKLYIDLENIQEDLEHLRKFTQLETIEICVKQRFFQYESESLVKRQPNLLQDGLLSCSSLTHVSFATVSFDRTEDWEQLFTHLPGLTQLTFDSTRQLALLQHLVQSPAACRKLTLLTLRSTRLPTSSLSLLARLTSLTQLFYPIASSPAFEGMSRMTSNLRILLQLSFHHPFDNW